MRNRKKFEKTVVNETYYETHADEDLDKNKKKSPAHQETAQETDNNENNANDEKKEKKDGFLGMDASNVPEKKKLSSRFTYTREKRKIVNEKAEKILPEKAPQHPFVYALSVLCLVLTMRIVAASDIFMQLSDKTQLLLGLVMFAVAYLVPTAVYLVTSFSGRRLHNIRKFSPKTLPFSASCLGLLLCLTALQKYIIAYVFSYSEPTAVSGGQSVVLSLLVSAFLPAICEELFVRGVFQHKISEYAGGLCGVALGALVFAMLHFEVQYFFVYFVSGLVLGSITHVTRSVFPAMAVHFLNNLLSILFVEKLSFVATERIGGTLLIIVLASMCFGFLILTLYLAEDISMKRADEYLATEQNAAVQNKKNEKNVFFIFSEDGKTPTRFAKIMSSPFLLVSLAIFVVAVFAGF